MNTKLTTLTAAATLTLAALATSACAPSRSSAPPLFAPGQKQIAKRKRDITYKPCPPTMPAGCELAVLAGNPRARGTFTMRIRTSRPFLIAPHIHPRAGFVTVLRGTLNIGFGAKVDKSKSHAFSAGDFYVNAPNTTHYSWADKPVTIQITGAGPWRSIAHR